jgi:23S rRNA (cytidine2498-2'-O)-methyltransferase
VRQSGGDPDPDPTSDAAGNVATPVITAYLAAEGFEDELRTELVRAGVGAAMRPAHGRLFVTDAPAVDAAWSLDTWFDAVELPVASIADAARRLRAVQRNWVGYHPLHRGRAALIAERLPSVSGRVLALGEPAPTAPLGSWTLLEPGLVLAAARCSSPFPNGEPALAELRHGPPSRAYRKLWEALLRLGRRPGPGERCVDLGASPGGWTWLLSELGADVLAVDRAPLDPSVAARPGVRWQGGSAFGLDPATVLREGPLDWVCSDIACYPDRLAGLLERWLDAAPEATFIATVKFQGPTDHAACDRFRALPGATLVHLAHNRHELTVLVDRGPTGRADPGRADGYRTDRDRPAPFSR